MVRWSWVNFQCRGVLLVWIRVGQGPTALAVGAGGGCLDIFTLVYPFSALSPSLWETTGSLSPKTTNQPNFPEAIPSGNIKRKIIMKALVKFFTFVCLFKSVQSDQGSNFMPDVF